MRNKARFITGLLSLAAFCACSAEYDMEAPAIMGNIHGIVTDSDGMPLNHIRVTLDYGDDTQKMTVYTSLKGEFIADMDPSADNLILKLEDIDGEENGGQFETLTDQITIMEDDLSDRDAVINLEYRLTRATALENSQQSL